MSVVGFVGLVCVIYCRISKDLAHTELGVQRQEKECRELCERYGLVVLEVFVDDDRSAYTGKPRPGYLAMAALIAAGQVPVVVTWHPDRLTRHPRELEDLIDLLEAHSVTVRTVVAGQYDLATPAGRMVARILGAAARHESEHKSARLRSEAVQRAERGEISGGGGRPFGFEPDRRTHRPVEAQVLREAAGMLVDGATLGSIARRLNDGEVLTVEGKAWTAVHLRRLLLRPRNAGLREHKGVVVGPAVWEGILDPALYGAVCAVLRDPTRRMNHHARPYLLTGGVARCGVCGGKLIARPRSDGARCYVCVTPAGCGKIRRLAEPVESEVVARLVALVGSLPTIEPVVAVAQLDIEADLATLEAKMANLAKDHYVLDVIGRNEYLAARDALAAAQSVLREQLTIRPRRRRTLPADLATSWPDMGHEDRRATVADWIDAVVILPATRGYNRFDPNKIVVRWKQ